MTLPLRFEDALAARERIHPYLQPTPWTSEREEVLYHAYMDDRL